tara:strand:- start:200 stop:394 length:195 start_codon:yes stop_codon:yes gene_type:complete
VYIVVVNQKEFKCRDASTLRRWKREKRVKEDTPVWDRLERTWTTVGQAILVRPPDGSTKKVYLS